MKIFIHRNLDNEKPLTHAIVGTNSSRTSKFSVSGRGGTIKLLVNQISKLRK